jgi:PAS domain S-box-containing protein
MSVQIDLRELNQQLQEKISDCNLLEEKLRTSEAKIRAVFEAMTDIVLVVNTQENQIKEIEVIPTSSSRLYGYSTDLIDKTVKQFFQGNTAQAWFQKVQQALDTKQTLNFDYCLSLDGGEVWFTTSISPISDNSAVWVARDISDRKRAEEAQRESKQFFKNAFDYAAIGMALVTPKGRFAEVNRSLCAIVGYPEKELLTKTFRDITHPEDFDTDLDKVRQLLDGEIRTYQIEKRYFHQLGYIVWVLLSVSLVRDRWGQPLYFIAQMQDITERKQALQELQRTQAQLVQNEKMSSLGRLLAGVAHEINNPTSFIYGNITPAAEYAQDLLQLVELYRQHYPEPVAEIAEQLEAIEPDFIAEDFPKLLASIKEGANRINQIVLSLRNFSRADEQKRKRVDIHEGIDKTLLILQHRLKQNGTRPEIQVIKQYGQLPSLTCYPGQLDQVFMNLLSNAIEALEEGDEGWQVTTGEMSQYLTPTIRIITQTLELDRVVIRIADNGSGISTEDIPRIFDPFFTTKPPGKGTGLGLSISYHIVVDKHGGQLLCHSIPGQGTEFAIELPTT